MINNEERRRSPRTTRRFPLRYQVLPVARPGYINALVQDLSPEGLRFQCSDEVSARSGLLLELQLPNAQPVHFFGRATWVRELPNQKGFEVGGKFEDQSSWGRRAVERFLQPGPTVSIS